MHNKTQEPIFDQGLVKYFSTQTLCLTINLRLLMTNNELKESFKRSPAIRVYQRKAWIYPVLIIITSITMSIYCSNWEHFSRSGALIVLVGVYIAYRDWSGDIYELAKNNYLTITDFLQIGSTDFLDEKSRNEFIEKSKKNEETHKKNRAFVRYASQRFRKMEFILLVIGTVIWGYGDLILNLIWNFNA